MVIISNVADKSINLIVSPALGEAGNVAVTAPPDVLTKYPLAAAALKLLLYALPIFQLNVVTEPKLNAPLPLVDRN